MLLFDWLMSSRHFLLLTSQNELQLHGVGDGDVIGELGVQVLQQVLNCRQNTCTHVLRSHRIERLVVGCA